MANEDNSDAPRFVWTFPLIRRFQSKNSVIDFGQSASTVSNTVESVRESSPVRDKVSDTITSDDTDDEDESVSKLMEEVEQVQEDSQSIFEDSSDYGQDVSESNTVEVTDNVFVPLRTEVEEGEKVVWENIDDEAHRIMATSGESFSSDQLEPGDEFTHTFEEEGVTRYIDSIVGGDVMCGAVLVGGAELDGPLRCEEDVDRELFDDDNEESDGDDARRTMSAAVEDKDEMDVGF